jgi:hypothetical protein
MLWPFGKRMKPQQEPPLLWLGNDSLTMHQAYEGFWISGSIGGGKTSGPADAICRALLAEGCGFLVLTAKPGEFARWQRLCEQTGRSADLVRAAPDTGWKCDLLNYEMTHPEGTSEAAAAMIRQLLELKDRQQGGAGGERYWTDASTRYARLMIETIYRAKDRVTFMDCYRFITSTAEDKEEAASDEWKRDSFCAECLLEMVAKKGFEDAQMMADVWLHEWAILSDKTRSILFSMILGVLDNFVNSISGSMVASGETNFTPDMIAAGKVCVLDMPVLKWREPGRFFQIMFKTLTQRATLRRDVTPDMKPVVVVQDEAQLFVTEFDVEVQTVARESRLVTMFITQSLPVLYEALGGGPKAEQMSHALIGNLQTKLLCQQSDKTTNQYFSELIGESIHHFMSGSNPTGDFDLVSDLFGLDQQDRKGSIGFNSQMRAEVLPSEFTKLRKGSKANGYVVDVIAFQGGRRFSNGKTWMKVAFQQRR